MTARNAHAQMDRVIQEQDRLIAARLRRDPRVLRLARRNLRRWMARESKPRAVFVDWNRILTRLTAREIAEFLNSGSPMARRLSQPSPFAGMLTEAERLAILNRHEKNRA